MLKKLIKQIYFIMWLHLMKRGRERGRERTWGCVWERKLNKNKRGEREDVEM